MWTHTQVCTQGHIHMCAHIACRHTYIPMLTHAHTLCHKVTFNYACVYLCVCDGQHSSVSFDQERFEENWKCLTQCGDTVVFIYSEHCHSSSYVVIKGGNLLLQVPEQCSPVLWGLCFSGAWAVRACAHTESGQGGSDTDWNHQELHPAGIAGPRVLPHHTGNAQSYDLSAFLFFIFSFFYF